MLVALGLMSDEILTPIMAAPPPAGLNYPDRPEIMEFIKTTAQERRIPQTWIESELALARYSPLAERYMTPKPKTGPATTPDRNFRLYKRNMVNAERIAKGVDFLHRHDALFQKMEESLGVSRYAVAAIIGVETIYGKSMGRFRVLDVLVTLAFDYTRRSTFYKKELAEFLEFCWRDNIPTVSVTGSFAGAIGYGQFMPSSLNKFGMDGNNDGLIDIINSEEDAIASVANYLHEHGWTSGLKALYPVRQKVNTPRIEPSTGIRPDKAIPQLLNAGIEPIGLLDLPQDHAVLLVDLPWKEAGEALEERLYLGTENFSTFLYYNRSYFYAAAVAMLADELEASYNEPAESP